MNSNNFQVYGDLDVYPGLDASNGTGSIYVRDIGGTFNVTGETFLSQTNIDTTSGNLNITGTNAVSIGVTGATGAVTMLSGASSYFGTTSGNLDLYSNTGITTVTGNSTKIVSSSTAAITAASSFTVSTVTSDITLGSGQNVNVNTGAGLIANSAGQISLNSNASSNFTVTGDGTLTAGSTTGRFIATSGNTGANAVTLNATNATGGVNINCGTHGLSVLAVDGPFSIAGQNVASGISLDTNANSQDFTISLTGTTNSSLVLESSGTGTDAVKINTTDAASGIAINTGIAGLNVLATNGPFIIAGQNVSSNVSLDTNGNAQDLTVSLTGATNSSIIIESAGIGADSIKLLASNVTSGIDIDTGSSGVTVDTTGSISLDSTGTTNSNFTVTGTGNISMVSTQGTANVSSGKSSGSAVLIQASDSGGGVSISSGTAGVSVNTTGGLFINAANSASNITLATNSNSQNLTVAVTGATNSSLILGSSGTGDSAVNIATTAGGILVNSSGKMSIQSTDTANGIKIGTLTNTVPITIGTANSVTTIVGNLEVQGTTTTINTQELMIEDNVIIINSGNGELGIDSGMIVRRYQIPNNTGIGNVVSDTDFVSGAFQASCALPGTLVLGTGASAVDSAYKGWWITVTSGTGVSQVRRIKSYTGSTKTATLYITSDNTSGFADGLDLVTAPAVADTYRLYNAPYRATYYREATGSWVLGTTATIPDDISAPGVSTISVTEYTHLDTGKTDIHGNTGPTDSQLTVNYINEHDTDQGVTIENVLVKDGLINNCVPDSSEIVQLIDNAQTPVNVTNSSTSGAFIITVEAVTSATGTGSTTRNNSGTFNVFIAASSGSGGSITRIASSKGSNNQRLDATWTTGGLFQLYHNPKLSGGTGLLIPYRVKVSSCL